MKNLKTKLEQKLKRDENLILKLISEIGDMARYMRGLEARITKLERKLNGRFS